MLKDKDKDLELKPYRANEIDLELKPIKALRGRIKGMQKYMANLSHQFRNKKENNKGGIDEELDDLDDKPIFNPAEFEPNEGKKSGMRNINDTDAER